MRLLPWAAARRAASSSAASSARSGGRAPRRRGRCIPPLAAAAAAATAAPRPRAEHPRALPGVPATSFRPLSAQDAGGVCKVLCPSKPAPSLRPAASGPRTRAGPSSALRLQPRLRRPVSPGLSVSRSRKASAPGSDSEQSAPYARGLPSRGSLGGGCGGSSRSARSLSGSQPPSTCHFPPTLQPGARARPMAAAGPGRRPSALCCRLSTPAPSLTSRTLSLPRLPQTHPPSPTAPQTRGRTRGALESV